LGPYEVLSSLGAGGMGEVYRAHDPRLGRDIAIKVLPSEFASDPERLKRFEREARAASGLSHPNIVTVYDVGKTDSLVYIAIELVDGESLHDLLLAGPLPVRKLLDIATQIADGLAAAHEQGIIHRDLKPRNVMVSRAGFVKILDFGLAKLTSPASGPSHSFSRTIPRPDAESATTDGVVLGTTDYMSPEQARGQIVDFRSDQFSFGAVLYEMITGRRAFGRSTAADTLSAILQQEPSPAERLRPDCPAPLRWILERCLAKAAADRYSSTRDLARELQSLSEHLSEVSGEQPPAREAPPRSRRTVAIAASALVLLAAVAAWLVVPELRRRPVEPQFRRLTFRPGLVSRALFVPNSNSILYSATWEGESAQTFLKLPESTSMDRSLESGPEIPMAYSEDGSQVLVVLGPSLAPKFLSGTLAWRPVLGGRPRPILDNSGWADWARHAHRLAVVRDEGAERRIEIRDADGALERVVFRTSGGISFVRFSPREDSVAFFHHSSDIDPAGEVRVVTVDGRSSRALTPRFAFCRGLSWNRKSGEIWFTIAGDGKTAGGLRAVALSGQSRLVYSIPGDFVLQDVSSGGDACLLTSSESRTSLLLRRPGQAARDFSWFNQTFVTDLSADGKSLLFYDGGLEAPFGSWIRSVEGGDAVRLGEWEQPRFSPDGKWIVALTETRLGPPQILLHPNGPGQTRQITSSLASHWNPSFTGTRTILYVRVENEKREIWRSETDGTGSRVLAAGCDAPMANRAGDAFVCIGEGDRSLFVGPVRGGPGRQVFQLGTGEWIRYARWNETGDRLLVITDRARLLGVDAATGSVLSEEQLPLLGPGTNSTLVTAALTDQGTLQAYSIKRSASSLYLVAGLR
jgi:serine/threonine protein kinase